MSTHSEFTLVMVDDDHDEIFLTRRLLRKEGIVNNFIFESKPERLFETLEGLRKGNQEKIIILLDARMLGQDGFATLKRIRSSEHFKDVPIIMLSGSDDEADMCEALSLGASGYVTKPFGGDKFFAALSNVPQVKHQLV